MVGIGTHKNHFALHGADKSVGRAFAEEQPLPGARIIFAIDRVGVVNSSDVVLAIASSAFFDASEFYCSLAGRPSSG